MADPAWTPTRRELRFDIVIAAALGAAAALSLYIGSDPEISGPMSDYPHITAFVSLTCVFVLLAARRRFPIATLLLGMAAYTPVVLADIPEAHASPVAVLILFYTAGAYGGRHRDPARLGVAATVAALIVFVIVRSPETPYDGRVPLEVLSLFTGAVNFFYFAGAWVLGDVVRSRRHRERVLEEQAAALAAAQAELEHRAVVDERVRIARELHDVLAHHVSLMGVQAAAARRVLDSRPAAVPELLGSIEGSSREALVELQRLLGLLREEGAAADTSGQPRLDRIDELAGQMRDAGLDVHVTVDAPGAALPAGVELSAYRIVQEALTNSLKHAGRGASAQVAVRRTASALELTVIDDGAGGGAVPASPGGPGHGLVGMQERVNLLGGELRTGRRAAGGFEVRAWFPLAPAEENAR